MTDPITPPPELVRKWATWRNAVDEESFWRRLAIEAARWGADQELEACCEWLREFHPGGTEQLRCSRRSKPPSLKEQALAVLDDCADGLDGAHENVLRRALEALDD